MIQGTLVAVITEEMASRIIDVLGMCGIHTFQQEFSRMIVPDYIVGSFGTIEPIDSEFANSIRNSVDNSVNS